MLSVRAWVFFRNTEFLIVGQHTLGNYNGQPAETRTINKATTNRQGCSRQTDKYNGTQQNVSSVYGTINIYSGNL